MSKRIFDIFFSFTGIISLSPFLIISIIIAATDTHSNGLFLQPRIGQYGKSFTIYKLRTMKLKTNKISATGAFLRKYKLDELPQLLNVLQGAMSIVGPRPDIAGYYDTLHGEERLVLNLKPGLTSEAAIKYADEEVLLAEQEYPLEYNDNVLFPDKVKLNLDYYYNHTFFGDLKIISQTIVCLLK
ncbi:sugar transferase [Lutibacter sp.]|uniref:sugar transferase n=1 Tax=Lutibacter sp. TaxID=1925666 RepID=UPI0027325AE9|nr:sugar transferase [Lutibacter sp.]MDP3313049.1 sugar transferase [Lutibacter sp.]